MHTGAPRPPWVLFTYQTTLDDSLSDKEECVRYAHTAGHPHCDTHTPIERNILQYFRLQMAVGDPALVGVQIKSLNLQFREGNAEH